MSDFQPPRERLREHGRVPNFRNLPRDVGVRFAGCNRRRLYDRFSMGRPPQAVRIAGLPEPSETAATGRLRALWLPTDLIRGSGSGPLAVLNGEDRSFDARGQVKLGKDMAHVELDGVVTDV